MVEEKLVAVVQEANSVSGIDNDWWLDTGATIHICKDRNLFKTYDENNGESSEVTSANKVTSKVLGKGTIELTFTSGKVLTLVNVFYVLDVCKNLVSEYLFNKGGFKMVYESDKLVLSKNSKFIRQGYSYNGMIKLNLVK